MPLLAIAGATSAALAAPGWIPGPPGPAIVAPRNGHGMAYDPARRVTVLYGGTTPFDAAGTYEYDGSGWHASPAAVPAALGPRGGHEIVYHASRARVVLFGGKDATGGFHNDTWEYDGAAWVPGPAAPASLTPRYGYAMSFHGASGRTVLFGGWDGGPRNDTWLYDGTAWIPGPAAPPSLLPRSGAAMASDEARARLVLFGGLGLDDTWEYDGASWLAGPAAPSGLTPRSDPAMAYDMARGVVIVFGGGPTATNDLWEYDGAAWSPGPAAPAVLAGRFSHNLAYDSWRSRVVLFGGTTGTITLGDTWEYDGAAWSPGIAAGPGPVVRRDHACTYDVTRARVVLFGGFDGSGARNDTWEFDGFAWTAGPAAPPGLDPRYGHAMAYDSARNETLLFGGMAATALADTWTYDGTAWAQGSPAPPGLTPRYEHAMAFDASRSRTVLYGGTGATTFTTWEHDGTSWIAGPAGPPALGPRSDHAMAYDDAAARTILLGGCGACSDTWLYDGTSWNPGPVPPAGLLAVTGMVLDGDAGRSRLVLFGGSGPSSYLNDTWELGAAWSAGQAAPAALSPRADSAMAFSDALGGMVLFGGRDASFGPRNDTWLYECLTISPSQLPPGFGGFPYSSTITAAGGTVPYTYSVTSGALPPGITLSPAGVLSGTTFLNGAFPFVAKAVDGSGCAGSAAYTLVMSCSGPVITLSPPTLPAAIVGAPYSQSITASGGTAPYTFSVVAGELPWGLALAPSGLLSGTPIAATSRSFTVSVQDASYCFGSRVYSLAPSCPAMTMAPATLPGATAGAPYAATLTVAGGNGPYAFALLSGALPAGLSLSPSGAISGTPASPSSSSFDVRAGDVHGCSVSVPFTIGVAAAPDYLVGQGLGPPNANRVRVYDQSGAPAPVDFFAYAAGQWGVNVASSDLVLDGWERILAGPGPGPTPSAPGPPSRAGASMPKVNFYAYGTLKFGVNVASASIDTDAHDETLTGAGLGAVFGPHVRGFNFDNVVLTAIGKVSFFAYGTLKYGANVARGDVDGDAFAEILTDPDPAGTSRRRCAGSTTTAPR
ncbi:MAG: putative Ig domain-containing protein [Acidobacteriota bacterium]